MRVDTRIWANSRRRAQRRSKEHPSDVRTARRAEATNSTPYSATNLRKARRVQANNLRQKSLRSSASRVSTPSLPFRR
eukprot:5157068-Pleurochrysis_carterae.AAC.2